LRGWVTPPFAERRQMLLVNAINLGLHLGMPALDEDGEFAKRVTLDLGTGGIL
jgi:hypothetical protein